MRGLACCPADSDCLFDGASVARRIAPTMCGCPVLRLSSFALAGVAGALCWLRRVGAVAAASAGKLYRSGAGRSPFLSLWLICPSPGGVSGYLVVDIRAHAPAAGSMGLDLPPARPRWAQDQVNGAISPWVRSSAPFLAGMGGLCCLAVCCMVPSRWRRWRPTYGLVRWSWLLCFAQWVAVWAAPRLVQRPGVAQGRGGKVLWPRLVHRLAFDAGCHGRMGLGSGT